MTRGVAWAKREISIDSLIRKILSSSLEHPVLSIKALELGFHGGCYPQAYTEGRRLSNFLSWCSDMRGQLQGLAWAAKSVNANKQMASLAGRRVSYCEGPPVNPESPEKPWVGGEVSALIASALYT